MIRKLASSKVGMNKKKNILRQKGGALGALLALAIPAISGLVSSLINK